MDIDSLVGLIAAKYYTTEIKDSEQCGNIRRKIRLVLKKVIDKNSIFKDFPVDLLDDEAIGKFVYHIMEESSDRQILSNIARGSINRRFDGFIVVDAENEKAKVNMHDLMPEYTSWNISREIFENRDVIKRHYDEPLKLIQDLNLNNDNIIRLLLTERQIFKVLGLRYKNYLYIEDYLDYVEDGIMQLVLYSIFRNDQIKDKNAFIEKLLDESNKIGELLDFQRDRENKVKKVDELSQYFVMYVHRKSYFDELDNIASMLMDEVTVNLKNRFCSVKESFLTEKRLVSKEELRKNEIVITEGEAVPNFPVKLQEARKIIRIFALYGGRSAFDNCLQDIKVYFREIFMSDLVYGGNKAASIARNYLKECENTKSINPFEKKSQYMFFREKINRGYFREMNMLPLYCMKSKLQKALHCNLLKVYLFYDYQDILEFIYEFNRYMLIAFEKLFEETEINA